MIGWIKTWGVLLDTFKESLHKFTVIAYFIMSALFLLLMALFSDFSNPEASAMLELFKESNELNGILNDLVLAVEMGFSSVFYFLMIPFSLFVVANLIPHMLNKGRADIYLSKPLHRLHLLGSKTLAVIAIVIVCVYFLIIGLMLILFAKTGIAHGTFLLSGLVIFYTFFVYYGFVLFIGVTIRNSIIAIMICYFILIMESIIHGIIIASEQGDLFEEAPLVLQIIYWGLPKSAGIADSLKTIIQYGTIEKPLYYLTTGIWGVVMYGLSAFAFWRKDY